MLAMELKASGAYLSRGLSYRDAEFELVTAPLTDEMRTSFDAAARFWSKRVLPELELAIERTGTAAGQLMRQYWSSHQRFFKQVRAPSRPRTHHPRPSTPHAPANALTLTAARLCHVCPCAPFPSLPPSSFASVAKSQLSCYG